MKSSYLAIKLVCQGLVIPLKMNHRKHIHNEKIDESLKSISKENPFSVPNGYFESLSNAVMDTVRSIPSESGTAKETGFTVPNGYFETLPEIILDRVKGKSTNFTSHPVIRPLYPVRLLALAAMLASVFFIYRLSHKQIILSDQPNEELSVQEISDSYLWEDLDEFTLGEAYVTENSDENTDDQSYKEYLIENHIDFTQLDIEL